MEKDFDVVVREKRYCKRNGREYVYGRITIDLVEEKLRELIGRKVKVKVLVLELPDT